MSGSAIDELTLYTLAHGDPAFIHQHVVDAYAAQTAGPEDRPIRLAFALAGLYLHLERGFTGRQVQLAHMAFARRKRDWPTFPLPTERGATTVSDVLAEPEGPRRDAKIHDWCLCAWQAHAGSRDRVIRAVEGWLAGA